MLDSFYFVFGVLLGIFVGIPILYYIVYYIAKAITLAIFDVKQFAKKHTGKEFEDGQG